MYNLQSGIHRQRFPTRLTPKQAQEYKMRQLQSGDVLESGHAPKFLKGQGRHKGAITGIAVDSLNRTVISCGEDGKIKFWDFATSLLLHEIDWYPMTRIVGLRYHRNSDLIALSCDDGSIRVLDITTKKLVRELWSSSSEQAPLRTIDYTFSNDGRWIISACSDSTVRVWDLPTGHLIDAMKLPKPCTTLAFSRTGEYLATGLEGDVGVHIWTNRTLFTHVSTRQISEEEIATISAPTASGEGGAGFIDATEEVEESREDGQEDETVVPIMDQLSEHITTLSLVPKSRWQTLLHLDVIRARNKPKEAPKPPEKAPFFLPSLQQDNSNSTVPVTFGEPDPSSSRITSSALTSRSTASAATNTFTSHLAAAADNPSPATYHTLLSYLSTLPPSSADLALRTLDTSSPYPELLTFISALTARLRERMDYELVQAWMAVFLRLHGDVVVRDRGLIQAVQEWQEEAKRERERVGGLVGYAVGVVGWVRSGRG